MGTIKLKPPRLPRFGPDIRDLADAVNTAEVMRKELQHFFDNMQLLVGGVPAYVIAAADASPKAKAVADFVCDGQNDEQELFAALAELKKVGGGAVLFSEGTFYIDQAYSTITDVPPQLLLLGSGSKTVLRARNGSADKILDFNATGARITIKDLTLRTETAQGYALRAANYSGVVVDGVTILGGEIQASDCEAVIITNSVVDWRNVSGIVAGWPIELSRCREVVVDSCEFIRAPGVWITASTTTEQRIVITGNTVWAERPGDAFHLYGGNLLCFGNIVYAPDGRGFHITASSGIVFGNVIRFPLNEGVKITDSTRLMLVDNRIHGAGMDGVVLDGCENCVVSGNIISHVGSWVGSYVGVRLTNSAKQCIVMNNSIVVTDWSLQYGILVEQGVDGTLIYGNDLRYCNSTDGAVGDFGTNTAFGPNFTTGSPAGAVTSIGLFGDATRLSGAVSLKAGAGIQLAIDEVNKVVEIASPPDGVLSLRREGMADGLAGDVQLRAGDGVEIVQDTAARRLTIQVVQYMEPLTDGSGSFLTDVAGDVLTGRLA